MLIFSSKQSVLIMCHVNSLSGISNRSLFIKCLLVVHGKFHHKIEVTCSFFRIRNIHALNLVCCSSTVYRFVWKVVSPTAGGIDKAGAVPPSINALKHISVKMYCRAWLYQWYLWSLHTNSDKLFKATSCQFLIGLNQSPVFSLPAINYSRGED